MYYGKIKNFDISNGPGVRVSLFVSGCRNHCKGCFQPETWSFTYGQEFTWDTLHEIEEMLKNPNIKGLSILGGDPFELENQKWVETLCAYVKYNLTDKDIWVWTGYKFEELIDSPAMEYIDVLVDGRYEDDKRDLRLKYRGSRNQRIINVRDSIETRRVIQLYDE